MGGGLVPYYIFLAVQSLDAMGLDACRLGEYC